MRKFFKQANRVANNEHKLKMRVLLLTSPLFNLLPSKPDEPAMSRTELASELHKKPEIIGEGLAQLKKAGLAHFDKKARGWRKANK